MLPTQVLLDVGSIQPDRVLLLDSYFYVVVFHGTTIAAWRKAEYHLLPEQVALKQLLEARPPPRSPSKSGHYYVRSEFCTMRCMGPVYAAFSQAVTVHRVLPASLAGWRARLTARRAVSHGYGTGLLGTWQS